MKRKIQWKDKPVKKEKSVNMDSAATDKLMISTAAAPDRLILEIGFGDIVVDSLHVTGSATISSPYIDTGIGGQFG